MLNRILSIIFFLCITVSSAQEYEWYEFDFDKIQIDFPAMEISTSDSIVDGIRLTQMFLNIEGSTLIVQRTPIVMNDTALELSALPHDKNSLLNYYESVAVGIKNSLEFKSFEKTEFRKDRIIGNKFIFRDDNGKAFYEVNLLVLDKDLYAYSYYNIGSFQEKLKNEFFSSVIINDIDSINQFRGNSVAGKIGYRLGKIFAGITIILILFGVVFFIARAFQKK